MRKGPCHRPRPRRTAPTPTCRVQQVRSSRQAPTVQTGYDEKLVHTLYVDKPLSGTKAVQTLSRQNRAHPKKHDCFVLGYLNNSDSVTCAFQDYFRTTMLAEETDPNKLHDLKAARWSAGPHGKGGGKAGGSLPHRGRSPDLPGSDFHRLRGRLNRSVR